MSANVNFYHATVFQAVGTQSWHWQLGDGVSYWGFSARPTGANNQVELQRVYTIANNDLMQMTHLVVLVSTPPPARDIRESGGGLFNFTAIGSS